MPTDDEVLITIDPIGESAVHADEDAGDGGGDGGEQPSSFLGRNRDRIGRSSLVALSLILAVLIALGLAMVLFGGSATSPDEPDVLSVAPTTVARPPAISAEVYEAILPSIVYIEVTNPASGDEVQFGVGTGVIVRSDGAILTANHVVAGADTIRLVFADGTEAAAMLAFADTDNDIALLLADRPPGVIVPAVLGNPGSMSVGDEAYAVGNPLGLAGSISAGVISGFDRTNSDPDAGIDLVGLIQFDAAVNPGSSGGPLLNRRGEVVGIVTSLANPSGDDRFSGIGFAVPIGTAVGGDGPGPGQ